MIKDNSETFCYKYISVDSGKAFDFQFEILGTLRGFTWPSWRSIFGVCPPLKGAVNQFYMRVHRTDVQFCVYIFKQNFYPC